MNASRAIVFSVTGRVVKTHAGARAKLFQLIREGLSFPREMADFLASGFEIKQDVDYGPEIVFVSREEAADYLSRARAFLAAARAACD